MDMKIISFFNQKVSSFQKRNRKKIKFTQNETPAVKLFD